uniref:Uncharacterized protein n=2 Tax=Aegilops tauschii TaxID=37682 RepID=A0A453BAA1_AEGTS
MNSTQRDQNFCNANLAMVHGALTLGVNDREETCLSLVADETATVHFLLWGTECDAFEPGDIVRLTSGIFSYHRGNKLFLRAGKRGRTKKVGEFTMTFVETPNMSIEMRWGRWGPDPGDPRKMVQEAVLSPYSQVFKPLH